MQDASTPAPDHASPGDAPDGWNWGAFWLNWVWGLAHNTWIALLMFVPGVNLVMPFVLGAKGNAWAWRNNSWRDVEHFRRVQRIWAWVGWGAAIGLPALIGLLFWGVTSLLTGSEPYQMALARINDRPALVQAFGQPIEPSGWWTSGNIEVKGDRGHAEMVFDVAGPRGEGTVYLKARKESSMWTFSALSVIDTEGRTYELVRSGGR